jgi:nicotinamide-nucleotide amidase
MKATIITIGDEILIGQIVDTNSVSIAVSLVIMLALGLGFVL